MKLAKTLMLLSVALTGCDQATPALQGGGGGGGKLNAPDAMVTFSRRLSAKRRPSQKVASHPQNLKGIVHR